MARSKLNLIVALPDIDGVLSVVEGAEVTVEQRNGGTVNVYSADTGGTTVSQPILSDAQGLVDGWVEDGHYKATADTGVDEIEYYFERRSGGDVKVFKGGFPGTTDYPQIVADEDPSGTAPAILWGSGAASPDVKVSRTGTKELTVDAVTTDTGKLIVKGDVTLGGSGKTVSLNSNRIQDVATPLSATDAVNRAYVDSALDIYSANVYQGYVHNLPVLTSMATMSNITADKLYAVLVDIEPNAVVSTVTFLRGTGTSSPTVQFGLFAEVGSDLVCIAATEKSSASWAATTYKELTVGYDDGGFQAEAYVYDPATLPENATGNIYAGLISSSAIPLTGATVTSPIISGSMDFPILAGESTEGVSISSVTVVAEDEFATPTSDSRIPFVRLKVA
jgi:hypothetical protein